jgi:hypothetical protein
MAGVGVTGVGDGSRAIRPIRAEATASTADFGSGQVGAAAERATLGLLGRTGEAEAAPA